MNKKKIIILALCLVVLLGVLLVVMNLPDSSENGGDTSSSDGSSQQVQYDEEPIYSLNTDSITEIVVNYDSVSYTLSKTSNGWICPDKQNVNVSQSRVTSLLSELSSVRYADSLSTSEVNPEDCGITEASNSITFNGELGTVTLYRGNDVSDSELCYLTCTLSDAIYMVKKDNLSRMFVPFDEYRNDTIANIDFENIVSIDFKNKKCEFAAVKGEYNLELGMYYAWRISSPLQIMARDSEIDSVLINPVSSISVDNYVSDNGDFGSYGLAEKSQYITYTDSAGKKQTIYFSDMLNNKYYICVDNSLSIYEVPASSVPFVSISLIDIADRQLYLNKQSNISSLEIKGNGYDYTLNFGDDSSITVNGNKNTDSSATREIFSTVCGPLADDISTAAMSDSLFTMTFTLKDSSKVVISFAKADDRYYNVSRDGKPLYTIMKSKIDSMISVLDKYK